MVIGVLFLAVSSTLGGKDEVAGDKKVKKTLMCWQTKFPECWLPGTFDYVGASHQIFHCFVVLGTLSHFGGIMSGYDWNYRNRRCAAYV